MSASKRADEKTLRRRLCPCSSRARRSIGRSEEADGILPGSVANLIVQALHNVTRRFQGTGAASRSHSVYSCTLLPGVTLPSPRPYATRSAAPPLRTDVDAGGSSPQAACNAGRVRSPTIRAVCCKVTRERANANASSLKRKRRRRACPLGRPRRQLLEDVVPLSRTTDLGADGQCPT